MPITRTFSDDPLSDTLGPDRLAEPTGFTCGRCSGPVDGDLLCECGCHCHCPYCGACSDDSGCVHRLHAYGDGMITYSVLETMDLPAWPEERGWRSELVKPHLDAAFADLRALVEGAAD